MVVCTFPTVHDKNIEIGIVPDDGGSIIHMAILSKYNEFIFGNDEELERLEEYEKDAVEKLYRRILIGYREYIEKIN